MLSTVDAKIAIIIIPLFIYMVVNAFVRRRMLITICTTEYKKSFFYEEIVKKNTILFVFFSIFCWIKYKRNIKMYNHKYDLFLLSKIDELKYLNNYSNYHIEIEEESGIRKRIKDYNRNEKLKVLKRKNKLWI